MTANAERLTDVEINLHFSPRPTVDSASEATFSAKGTFRDPVKLRNKLENKQAPLGHSHDPTAELSDLGGGSASTRRCALTEVAMLTFVKLFFVVVVFNNIQLNGSTKLMPATGGGGPWFKNQPSQTSHRMRVLEQDTDTQNCSPGAEAAAPCSGVGLRSPLL